MAKYPSRFWMTTRPESFPVHSWLGSSIPSSVILPIDFLGTLELLPTSQLVGLYLYDIPHSGYMSPEVMFAALSMLVSK